MAPEAGLHTRSAVLVGSSAAEASPRSSSTVPLLQRPSQWQIPLTAPAGPAGESDSSTLDDEDDEDDEYEKEMAERAGIEPARPFGLPEFGSGATPVTLYLSEVVPAGGFEPSTR